MFISKGRFRVWVRPGIPIRQTVKKNEKLSSRNEMKFRFFQIPPTKIAFCVFKCVTFCFSAPIETPIAQKACKPRKFATSFRCWIGSCRHRSEIRTFFQRLGSAIGPSNGRVKEPVFSRVYRYSKYLEDETRYTNRKFHSNFAPEKCWERETIYFPFGEGYGDDSETLSSL